MKRKYIIKNLEALFNSCYTKEQKLLQEGKKQNDVRVTFFKHMINTINSSIHLIIFSDTVLFTDEWWSKSLSTYKIQQRHFGHTIIETRNKEIEYIDQHLTFSFFIFTFHTLESSFKMMCKHCFPSDYYMNGKNDDKGVHNFRNLFERVMCNLNLWDDDLKSFIEVVVKFRNSLHNNGVFINDKGNSPPPLTWENNTYSFTHGQPILIDSNSDLWNEYLRFTRKFISVFEKIIKSPEIQKHGVIEDVTES